MANRASLKKAVGSILKEKGADIFFNAQDFRRLLIEQNVPKEDAITVELMLSSCPALANALSSGTISRMEANSLVSIIIQKTSLSPAITRRIVGELLIGRGVDPSDYRVAAELINDTVIGEKLSENLKKKGYQWSLIDRSEKKNVINARRMIYEGREYDSALSELDRIAQEGNAEAYYALGEYYLRSRKEKNYKLARRHLQLSAKLGYGPAFGALAEIEICSERGSFEKAAKYLEHPVSIKGKDGRKWSGTIEWMMNYQHANSWRAGRVFVLALIVFVVSLIAVAVNPTVGRVSCILSVVCAARALFCIFKNKYQSLVPESLILTAAWFLFILILL